MPRKQSRPRKRSANENVQKDAGQSAEADKDGQPVPQKGQTISPEKVLAELPEEFGSIEKLQQNLSELSEAYITKHAAYIHNVEKELVSSIAQVDDLQKKCTLFAENTWWQAAISREVAAGKHDLVEKVLVHMSDPKVSPRDAIVKNISNETGLIYACYITLERLRTAHKRLREAVLSLNTPPTETEMKTCINCHLRPYGNKSSEKCVYCKCDLEFNACEGKLFNIIENETIRRPLQIIDIDEQLPLEAHEGPQTIVRRSGTWADGIAEQLIKLIFYHYRSTKGPEDIVKDGTLSLDLFEAFKREFRALRNVWMRKRDYVSALDELEMAKLRYRLRLPGEEHSRDPITNVIELEYLMRKQTQHYVQRQMSRNLLKEKVSRLMYLKNVIKTYSSSDDEEICPICQYGLKHKWCILHCGHRICVACFDAFINTRGFDGGRLRFQCPICREYTACSNVLFTVNTLSEPHLKKIRGSYSTKVMGILDILLKLQDEDPLAKTIIFSSFDDVLNIIGEALRENDIPHVDLIKRTDFISKIEKFKVGEENILLLPLRTGANGLNIIEATHVIFAEPILNSAKVQQATGRVHRIGQERETYVHRLFIGETIEERIQDFTKQDQSVSAKDDVGKFSTIKELKTLFERF